MSEEQSFPGVPDSSEEPPAEPREVLSGTPGQTTGGSEGVASWQPGELGEVPAQPSDADFALPQPGDEESWREPASSTSQTPPAEVQEINSDDRLMGALAWAVTVLLQIPAVSVVLLLADGNKNRQFQRYHAITSLVFWGVAVVYEILAGIVFTILTLISLGCLGLILWILFFLPHLAMLYYAYQAYNGRTPEIPFVSNFARQQHWL